MKYQKIFFILFFLTSNIHAQVFPEKPIQIIVPFPPGGGTDVVARAIAPKMSDILGVQVLIQNHAGAGSSLGTELVARLPADGYSLLLVSSATAINQTLDKNISWNLLKDFDPVILLLFNQSLLVAHTSIGANTVSEFLALAKKNPKRFSYASSGAGSSAHLGMELLKMMSGIELLHIPYRGAAPAMNDLVGGQVDLMLVDVSVILPQVKAGKVKVLGIGSLTKTPILPEVKTVSETGITGFEVSGLIGLSAPFGTPSFAIQKINFAANEALKETKVRERLLGMAMILMGGTPDRLRETVEQDVKKWSAVINSAKLEK